jgi:hypothetical protein
MPTDVPLRTDLETRDCTEGCSGDHRHKWEIEPHAYTHDFDVYVSDSDKEALQALRDTVEAVFDDMNPGDTRTITIRMNDT